MLTSLSQLPGLPAFRAVQPTSQVPPQLILGVLYRIFDLCIEVFLVMLATFTVFWMMPTLLAGTLVGQILFLSPLFLFLGPQQRPTR